ncbi:MAG: hypothetical protein KKG04_09355 [Candidatus Thermoplasmatota archaeon]|nr:hypothetical protein [Candidatus Thermoplasmatota archaeon]
MDVVVHVNRTMYLMDMEKHASHANGKSYLTEMGKNASYGFRKKMRCTDMEWKQRCVWFLYVKKH